MQACAVSIVYECIALCLYQRDDALLVCLLFPHHGVGFSSSRLPVGENADVVALEGVKQHLFPDVPVHLLLGRIVDVLRLQKQRTTARLRSLPTMHCGSESFMPDSRSEFLFIQRIRPPPKGLVCAWRPHPKITVLQQYSF